MPRIEHLTAVTGSLLAAAVLAAGPAGAHAVDVRSPDTRDGASRPTAAGPDLRSPDTRDGATRPTAVRHDLRSPDARDSGIRRAPHVVAPTVTRPVVAPETGLDWQSAGIGALASAGLLISLAGGGLLVVRRRPRVTHPA
jgi:hypothetical protein